MHTSIAVYLESSLGRMSPGELHIEVQLYTADMITLHDVNFSPCRSMRPPTCQVPCLGIGLEPGVTLETDI
jgi:hypothetical protein